MRGLGRLAGPLAALCLAGCSVWQYGREPPDIANDQVHRGLDTMEFDPYTNQLATGDWDGRVALWSLPGEEPRRVWSAQRRSVRGIGFTAETIVTAGFEGSLKVWDRAGRLENQIETPVAVRRMRVYGDRVVSGHDDGTVRVWTVPDLREVQRYAVHDGLVASLAVHEPSGRIASGGFDGSVYLMEPGAAPRRLADPPSDARSLSFTPDGRTLYGGGWFRLFRWDLATGQFTTVDTPHWGLIVGLQYVPSERALATISRVSDSSVFFVDPDTGESVRHFQRQPMCGSVVRVSADGRYLASTGEDGSVRVWDLTAL